MAPLAQILVPLANILQPLEDAANAVLTFVGEDLGLGYGIAIIVLTFVTRIVILPLSIRQIKSMRALQAYSPQIKEINERYKDDPQRKQRELMAFYKTNQINPLASCFPLLLQLPVFFALFQLLRSDEFKDEVNAYGNDFLFIPDLTENLNDAPTAIFVSMIVTLLRDDGRLDGDLRRPSRGSPADPALRVAGHLHALHSHLPGGPRPLLDHHQRLDHRPAVRGQGVLAGAARGHGRGSQGHTGSPSTAQEEEEAPLTLAGRRPRRSSPSRGTLVLLLRDSPPSGKFLPMSTLAPL